MARAKVPGAAPDVTPEYWDEACRHLVKRDRVMKKLIPQFGEARLKLRGDAFTTLARSVIGQQITVKSAQALWERFLALTTTPGSRILPAAVLAQPVEALRAIGLAARKTEYVRDLARHFEEGNVHVKQWAQMEDEAIVEPVSAPVTGRGGTY